MAQNITAIITFSFSYPKTPEAVPLLLRFTLHSHILLFVPAVMIENKMKSSKGPLPVFSRVPLTPELFWRQPGVDFSPQSIHFNHVGQRRERHANWLAGICIYSTQQNVTDGLGGDLCGLLAKQTDEGNLSCRLCSTEQGQPRPLLLALSVTCHAAVGRDEMSQHRRRQKRSSKDRDRRDDSLICRTVLYFFCFLFSPRSLVSI